MGKRKCHERLYSPSTEMKTYLRVDLRENMNQKKNMLKNWFSVYYIVTLAQEGVKTSSAPAQ